RHPIQLFDEEFEVTVENSRIPYTNPLVAEALTRKISIITEVELAGQIAECPIVSITGTNAKTTTTTMIGLLTNADRTA
ncbi:UDP-N-acetylmuramoyl-L-alanine--D-glutamate ligase, partial [Enterococcus faecalis]